jgi:predicted DsbA family dithiol-disulfide isomerase
VRAAHRFAMANPLIRGDMVEISEFQHLAVKYAVQGVPQTIINESVSLVGAQPEMNVVQEILKAIGK